MKLACSMHMTFTIYRVFCLMIYSLYVIYYIVGPLCEKFTLTWNNSRFNTQTQCQRKYNIWPTESQDTVFQQVDRNMCTNANLGSFILPSYMVWIGDSLYSFVKLI